ncbi:uroporphyrinogen-III C-methyltransferase [Branchiibius cervicis]|uniref:uroporphyrinogen-III C-methyltransferase n=1 Tax=Branchiibius cervicis TaxID=908252 RepID=A0ABW2AXP4_9MICO
MAFVSLDLRGRRVVVATGGARAGARVRELLADGAQVEVISPTIGADLTQAYPDRTFVWTSRVVVAGDLDGAWLVSAPDADAELRERLRAWCDARGIWLEMVQSHVQPAPGTPAQAGQPASPAVDAGSVTLVGGGPGDPDLLTLAGWKALQQADVVVTDRLAPVSVVPAQTEIIDVGKTPYHHPVPQSEINEILIDRARQGQRVVRLKGGDPYLLGRGGEEVLACRAAGVPVHVIPGITSAFAGPAAADIPVTHRAISHGVLVISGHDQIEPDLLARWPHTIVVLMGMGRLRELAAGLVGAGRAGDTPVAVVHRASTPQQRVASGTLATIADVVAESAIGNPAVIVVGEVTRVLRPH